MKRETCGTCVNMILVGDSDDKGHCYRHPPIPLQIDAREISAIDGRPVVRSHFPACGEYWEDEEGS